MSDLIVNWTDNKDDVTRTGILVHYDKRGGRTVVKRAGSTYEIDTDDIQKIIWGKYQDDSQEEMFQ